MTDLPLALAWAPRKQGASPARSTTRASRSPTSPRRAATPATCTSGSDGMLAQAEAEASCHELLPVWPGFDQRTRDRRRLTDKTDRVMWPRQRQRRGRGLWALLDGRPSRSATVGAPWPRTTAGARGPAATRSAAPWTRTWLPRCA